MTAPTIQSRQGRVAGSEERIGPATVWRFLGIPYAAAPVGALRFGPPRLAQPWEGARDATAFRDSPAQTLDSDMVATIPGMTVGPTSEDCLTLNVWAPPGAVGLPVLVWFYGGGFLVGGSCLGCYDGAALAAEQQVVVVTVNYRVGALGFLDLRAHGGDEIGARPNCGLRDQLLALRWVSDNIAAFGGDAERITVFGESAGAGSVLHLITSPLRHGIRRAIAQSPGVTFTQHPQLSSLVAGRLLERLGATSARELLEVPVAALIDAQVAVSADLLAAYGPMVFHPVVDDDVCLAPPAAAVAAGAAGGVDLLIGATADEMRLYLDPRLDGLDPAALEGAVTGFLRQHTGNDLLPAERGADLVAGYRRLMAGIGRTSSSDLMAAVTTDATMRVPIYDLADRQARHRPATYAYTFDWQPHGSATGKGAFHAIDIPFTFDTFDRDGWADFLGVDEQARSLGRTLRSAWAAFAGTGDPSCGPTGPWPAYEPSRRATMSLDVPVSVVEDPIGPVRPLWQGLGARPEAAGAPAGAS